MLLDDFVFAMQHGNEIEFRINGELYFLQPDYTMFDQRWNDKKPPYPYSVLYKCDDYEKPMEVFRGTTEEVINYKFYNMFTLKCDFLKFQIDYSL